MARHSMVAKTALLLFVCLVSVKAVDWSTLTAEQLSQLPASDFANIKATDLASIPPAACAGFQSTQIAAIPIDIIAGFTDSQLAQLPSASCFGFSGAQMKAFAPTAWNAITPACIGNLSASNTGGCTGFSAAVFDRLNANQLNSITAQCFEFIPPLSFNVTKVGIFSAINPAACGGFTPQQMNYIPPNAGFYFGAECVANLNLIACTSLDPVFVSKIPANSFDFSLQCIAKMAPNTFSKITIAQFGAIPSESCAAFTKGLVSNFPKFVASNLTPQCLQNFTGDACAGLTYDFTDYIQEIAYPGFTAQCLLQLTDDALRALDNVAIRKITPQAFAGFNRLYAFSQKTFLSILPQQWKNVGSNLGGATGFGILQVLLDQSQKKLATTWTNAQLWNYWQLDQFMYFVQENVKYTQIADLPWNTTIQSMKDLDELTWMEVALLEPGAPFLYLDKFAAVSMPGLRTDQILSLPAQSFQDFTPAQAYYFRSNIISIFSAAQIGQLKPETFANMTNGFKCINPAVISNLTVAQLRAVNETYFGEFSCEQLRQFKNEQIQPLSPSAQNRFADLRLQCLSWSDPANGGTPSKLTLVEIVLIACGSAVIVIAIVVIAVVKIKKNAADLERAPLLGAEDGRVNNPRKQ